MVYLAKIVELVNDIKLSKRVIEVTIVSSAMLGVGHSLGRTSPA